MTVQDQTIPDNDMTAEAMGDEFVEGDDVFDTNDDDGTYLDDTPSDDDGEGHGVEDDSADDQDDEAGDDREAADEESDSQDAEGAGEKETATSIDPKTILRLGRMNLSDEQTDKVLSFGSNEAINNALDLLQQNQAADAESKQGGEEEKLEWFEIGEELDLDDDLKGVLKGMNEGTQKAVNTIVEKLSEKFESKFQSFNDQIVAERIASFDACLEDMGKEWTDVFGEGPGEALADNSVALQNREKVWQAANGGQYKGTFAKRAQQAARALFPEHFEKVTRKSVANRARDRQGKFIERSGARKLDMSQLSPEQRAVVSNRQMARKWGVSDVEDYSQDDGDFIE